MAAQHHNAVVSGAAAAAALLVARAEAAEAREKSLRLALDDFQVRSGAHYQT